MAGANEPKNLFKSTSPNPPKMNCFEGSSPV